MKNYSYVLEFSNKTVSKDLIVKALKYAWQYTPSKNNFMNYSVHVIGPENKNLRQSLYYKCLEQQMKANNQKAANLDDYDKYLHDKNQIPNFKNILSAPYIIIYTQRVCKSLNRLQELNVKNGMVFEQTYEKGTRKYDSANKNSRVEVGMFSANFSSKCLKLGIDISYIACMPTELEAWQEPEWNFISHRPIIIQLAGYGEVYKKDVINPVIDLKPNFDEVVNIL